ncbi:hypothetical protein [Chryseobacterium piperi]|uniref:hypothetical protein n=1 Tax=Chryseobacterium piperi TaxID=558152 RepID=UPI000B085BE8|nr:hypothetical protein [Chryseobacterium piperi]
MNKKSFTSYPNTIMAAASVSCEYNADHCLSQHQLTFYPMCFDMIVDHMMIKL